MFDRTPVGRARGGSEAGESGQKEKTAPGGRRKPLKRLVSDKEIKANSKDNPSIFQTFPRIFQAFSKKSMDFQGMRRRMPLPSRMCECGSVPTRAAVVVASARASGRDGRSSVFSRRKRCGDAMSSA